MRSFIVNILIISILCVFVSCDKNDNLEIDQNSQKNFVLEQVPKTKSSIDADSIFSQYNLYSSWGNYYNVLLNDESIQRLNDITYLAEPILATSRGCTRYEKIGSKYKLFVKGYSYLPDNIYIVQDVYAYQDIWIPMASFNIFPQDSPNCGWNPNAINVKGFTSVWNSNNGSFTFKTRLIMCESDIIGQSIFKSIPVDINNIEWNYAYFSDMQ